MFGDGCRHVKLSASIDSSSESDAGILVPGLVKFASFTSSFTSVLCTNCRGWPLPVDTLGQRCSLGSKDTMVDT